MEYKLFISAAGRGTRVAGLNAINKSLLPINYEAVISKIIDSYPKFGQEYQLLMEPVINN